MKKREPHLSFCKNTLPAQRIGVWNTAFLGDALLTLPLLQMLNYAYPTAQIDFYVRKGVAGLFRASPFIQNVFEYDKRSAKSRLTGIFDQGKNIRKHSYDLWISTHNSMRSALISKLGAATYRIGYDKPWFNRLCYQKTVDRKFEELQEIERLLQLLLPLDLDISSPPWPELYLPEASITKAESIVDKFSGKPLLGLHPGSVWPTKRWPVEYFANIGLKAMEYGAQIILFAGPGEEEMAAKVKQKILDASASAEQCSGFITDLSGKLQLTELAAVIARLNCYLTNDSGPMHMAWIQRTPVVALFGPTVRSLGFVPRGDSDLLEINDLACRPCGLHGHQTCPKGHFRCMLDLSPDLVWPYVENKLFKK